jgi:hypothetical protein
MLRPLKRFYFGIVQLRIEGSRKLGSRTTTYLFENQIRVPNFPPTPFEKLLKLSFARFFWRSRGLNVRELQNLIERSVIVCETKEFSVDESWLSRQPPRAESPTQLELRQRLASEEREAIEAALMESRGRVFGPSGAAARLGIARSTLESKIKTLKIDKNRFRVSNPPLTKHRLLTVVIDRCFVNCPRLRHSSTPPVSVFSITYEWRLFCTVYVQGERNRKNVKNRERSQRESCL